VSPGSAAALLALAAETVAARARGRPLPDLPALGPDAAPRGVFVSLYRAGELRGCIGHVEADQALPELVRDMAVAASREDPRFPPVAPDELFDLEVELSVLTLPEPVRPDQIVAGRDGVVVRRGAQQGILLPQVAEAHGWDAGTLLSAACAKAGLAAGAWSDPGTTVLAFRAQVIRREP